MAHVRVATYTITKDSIGEIAEKVQRPGGMLDIFRKSKGFVRYGLADLGDHTMASISVWESREEADAAVEKAAVYVKEELSDRLSLNTNAVGDFAFWSN